jgi:hypothetical protein
MNNATNKPHTIKEWRKWIKVLDKENLERLIDSNFINRQAHKVHKLVTELATPSRNN